MFQQIHPFSSLRIGFVAFGAIRSFSEQILRRSDQLAADIPAAAEPEASTVVPMHPILEVEEGVMMP